MATCEITIENNGKQFDAPQDEIILDTALARGIALPHQCRGASCGTCKAKISKGSVDHGWALGFAITEEEKQQGYCLLCQARPTSAQLVLRTISPIPGAEEAPQAIEFDALVVAAHNETPRVRRLIVQVPEGISFDYPAGTYAEIKLDGIDPPRVYSFASVANTARLLEFYVALHPHGKASTRIHQALQVGDRVRVRGPFGQCRLPPGDGPVLCAAGGTGVAPVLAIMEEALQRGLSQPAHLIFSVRDNSDIFALERLHTLRANYSNFSFSLTVTDSDNSLGAYRDLVPALLPKLYQDLSNHRLILSGSPGFVDACTAAALALSARTERISFDRFTPAAPVT